MEKLRRLIAFIMFLLFLSSAMYVGYQAFLNTFIVHDIEEFGIIPD